MRPHSLTSVSPTMRNAGPMSMPNPTSIPAGTVIRKGVPAVGGSDLRLGRMGTRLYATSSQPRSGGRAPIARMTSSSVACTTPLPRSRVS